MVELKDVLGSCEVFKELKNDVRAAHKKTDLAIQAIDEHFDAIAEGAIDHEQRIKRLENTVEKLSAEGYVTTSQKE